MNNTGVIFVRMCNTAGAVGLMLQYYCSTASTANFTAVLATDFNPTIAKKRLDQSKADRIYLRLSFSRLYY